MIFSRDSPILALEEASYAGHISLDGFPDNDWLGFRLNLVLEASSVNAGLYGISHDEKTNGHWKVRNPI